jgi:hypothetical protein
VGVKVAEEGDRLAWAAYGAGKMDLAQRWASAADEGSTLTRWVKSRLHLRAGRVREAAEELAKITFKLAPAEKRLEWNEEYRDEVSEHIQAELGVLRLGQREYVEALGLFLRAGLGEDAGYIAERVLTIEELKDYVDKRCDEAAAGQWQSETIRYILARRLARLGRCDEAVTYYPECWRKTFQAFTAFMENSRNRALGKHDRAENLWQAARITRYEGMELFGTEVEPDWHAWGGDYATMAYAYYRSAAESNEVTAATSDEKERIQRHVVEPAMRFHYRYIAAEMAWEAAELMPDNSDQTARVLCVAGSWLKNQDPNYADTFYKALVRRCSKTQLGREADARRWFPAIEDDWPASVNSHRPNRTSGEGT